MSRPSRTIALGLLMASACGWQPKLREIDLGVDVRLNAVAADLRNARFIAVGSGGTVVRDDGVTWDLGNVELRDIHNPFVDPSLLFVVGDAGTIVVGRQPNPDDDIEWLAQETGTTSNLYAIVFDEDIAIAVGDEVVLIGQPTAESGIFEWNAEPVPPGGWGKLRDVELEYDEVSWIRTAGLQGRMWLADSQLEAWVSIDAGTDEDLVDIYSDSRICGTRGTIVTCGGDDRGLDECSSESVGDFDFVACSESGSIGTDRRIHVEGKGSYRLDWQPRAIDEFGVFVVGDRGHAGWWWPDLYTERG